MACSHVQLPGGATAIVCGLPKSKPQRCEFCDAPATLLCDWPTNTFQRVDVVKLRRGDRVQLGGNRVGELVFCQVEISAGKAYLAFSVHGKIQQVAPDLESSFQVERPATCDVPCCELHARELGDDRHYCAHHWRAWESVS